MSEYKSPVYNVQAIPVEKIKAKVESNGAEFHLYDGADHAFDNTLPAFFHAEASKLAWERTLKFLADHVG